LRHPFLLVVVVRALDQHCRRSVVRCPIEPTVEFTRKSLHNPCRGVLRVTSFGHQALIAAQVDAA
jgi:hypothetical protein